MKEIKSVMMTGETVIVLVIPQRDRDSVLPLHGTGAHHVRFKAETL